MNPNNFNYNQGYNLNYQPNGWQNFANGNNQDKRLIGGGFAFPFLLGGVTGAALAPAFWGGGYGRPYYNNYYYYPYPYQRPYYYR